MAAVALLAVAAASMSSGNVLVVGGSGRVGASTVRWLNKLDPSLKLAIGGRSKDSFDKARSILPSGVEFCRVDLDGGDEPMLAAVSGRSLVVHTAGPFQQREDPSLLRASIMAGVPYCDVCDEVLLLAGRTALLAAPFY